MPLDHSTLVAWAETSVDAQHLARRDSLRDRDYKDGLQITQSEQTALRKRGQPAVVNNFIKRRIDYLTGLERQQRTDPRGVPRTPVHEEEAEVATDALRFVVDNTEYDQKRSAAFEDMLVEGACAAFVGVKPNARGEPEIDVRRIAWERLLWDQHSRELDFEDARWKGIVTWMDLEEALSIYPGEEDKLKATMRSLGSDSVHEDKPSSHMWSDKTRKRVMVLQVWYRDNDGVQKFAELTGGGILRQGVSPYLDEFKRPENPLILQSAYMDRHGSRYGLVSEMIDLQDEINKRRSKALHALSVNQLWYESGAFKDPYQAALQMARPDGRVEINPGMFDRVIDKSNQDLAQSQVALYQEAKNEISDMGSTPALTGREERAKSGTAIKSLQQGGFIEIRPLLDRLSHLDKRVYRQIWHRVRQYWTGPKWIQVTDDEQKPRPFMLNEPMIDTQTQQVVGMRHNISELDVDIIVEEQPDIASLQSEQFEILANILPQLAQLPAQFSELLIQASSLRNKKTLLQVFQGGANGDDPQAQRRQQIQQKIQETAMSLEFAEKQSVIDKNNASADNQRAQALRAAADATAPPEQARHIR